MVAFMVAIAPDVAEPLRTFVDTISFSGRSRSVRSLSKSPNPFEDGHYEASNEW